MLIISFFVILGVGVFLASYSHNINTTLSFSISASLFILRVLLFIPVVFMGARFYGSEIDLFFVDESVFVLLAIAVVSYSFFYFLHRKIIFTSLLRTSEITARFTLDLLPGEQLAIDVAKKDGLFSVIEADESRKRLAFNAFQIGSLEPKIRLIGSESITSLFLIVISASLNTLTFTSTENVLSLVPRNLFVSICAGSIMLLSSSLTFSIIFRSISRYKEDNQKNLLIKFSFAVSKFVLYLSVMFLILNFFIFPSTILLKAVLFDVILLLFIVASYLLLKMKNSTFSDNKFYEFIPFKSSSELTLSNGLSLNENDLVVSLYLQYNVGVDSLDKLILNSIIKVEGLLLPIHKIILKNEINQSFVENSLNFEWKGNERKMILDLDSEVLSESIIEEFKDFFAPISKQEFLLSDLSRIYNYFYINEKNIIYKSLDLQSLQFIKKSIDNAFIMKIDIFNIKVFTEICLTNFDEEDESSVIKDLFELTPEGLRGRDGISRVIYLENDLDQSKLKFIKGAATKLKLRGLNPLIIVSEEGNILENVENCIVLKSEHVPKNLKFFPIAQL